MSSSAVIQGGPRPPGEGGSASDAALRRPEVGGHLYLNDQRRGWSGGTLLDLAKDLSIAEKRGVAFAVNGEVISRPNWGGRALVDGEKVLLIQASQGG